MKLANMKKLAFALEAGRVDTCILDLLIKVRTPPFWEAFYAGHIDIVDLLTIYGVDIKK